jgi:tetratricopeptide (TPR) repeat protein
VRDRRSLAPFGFSGWLAVVFVIALGLRLVHLWQLSHAPFFHFKMGDAEVFDAWAREIAAGDWLGDEVFWYAPLYPYCLGVVYLLLGDGALGVLLVQAVLGAGSCVLVALAGARFVSQRAGLLAGLLLACYAPAIFFDALFQKPVLAGFLVCLVLWTMGRLDHAPQRTLSWLALGLALGCAALTQENLLVLAAPIVLWIVVRHRGQGRRRAGFAVLFVLGMALAIVPVALRNWVVGGEFHLTAANFGDNFYKGNNPEADGLYLPLAEGMGTPWVERRAATELAERALGRKLGPSEVSRYWTRRALEYIASDPGHWLRLSARKLALAWNAAEAADTEDLSTHAEWSLVLRTAAGVLHFGMLAPLAACGVWLTWPARRRLWVLYLMLAAYTASVVMFYVFARYRYPLVPLLALFAGAGLSALPALLRGRRPWAIVGCAVTALAVAGACNWPMRIAQPSAAVAHFNIGVKLQEEGRPEMAVAFYRDAVRRWPSYAEALTNLGTALEALGRLDEAVASYLDAVEVDPRHAPAQHNLGRALQKLGRLDEAVERLRAAVEIDPESPLYQVSLGTALKRQGHLEEAVRSYRRALELDPERADAHHNLGNALWELGRTDEAILEYRQACRMAPDSPWANYGLGLAWALATHPDPASRDSVEAVAIGERAAQVTRRSDPAVLDALARIYAAAGRFGDAVTTGREALERARAAGDPRAPLIEEHLRLLEAGRADVEPGPVPSGVTEEESDPPTLP